MNDARRARSRPSRARRWAWHLLVALITAVLASLGFWQLSRHAQLQRRNALLVERLAADPRPYPELTAALDPDAREGAPGDARNRPVTAVGFFDPEHEVLLRGRAYEGQPGHHVLTPLILLESGGADAGPAAPDAAATRVVLVDRGWVPYRVEGPGLPAFAPPEGRVRVTGRLMPEADPPEGFLAGLAPRDPPTGALDVVARADVERLADQMPYALDPYLIEAEAISRAGTTTGGEGPAAGGAAPGNAAVGAGAVRDRGSPVLPPRPGPEPGPHVGYAIQWFAFALTAAIGYLLLIRRR